MLLMPSPEACQGEAHKVMLYVPVAGSSLLPHTHPVGLLIRPQMYRHFKPTFNLEWQACTTSKS